MRRPYRSLCSKICHWSESYFPALNEGRGLGGGWTMSLRGAEATWQSSLIVGLKTQPTETTTVNTATIFVGLVNPTYILKRNGLFTFHFSLFTLLNLVYRDACYARISGAVHNLNHRSV